MQLMIFWQKHKNESHNDLEIQHVLTWDLNVYGYEPPCVKI